jgi:hypothetical protein
VISSTYTSEFPSLFTSRVFSLSVAIEEDSYINFSSRNVTLKNEKVFPSVSTAKSLLYITRARECTGDHQPVVRETTAACENEDVKKIYVLDSRFQ